MLVLEGLAGLHRTIQLLFFSITARRLGYCGIEWFALEMNRDHSVIFEIATNYCISDSFVDYDSYSTYFKGFLPISNCGQLQLNPPILVHFSLLIPKMSTLTLAISCLTASNLT